MKSTRWLYTTAVSAVILSTSLTWAQGAPQGMGGGTPEITLETIDLGKGVYFLKSRSDASFVVGKDGVIVFDDIGSGYGEPIIAEVAKVTKLPIKYLVNTHFHSDHTGSNETFGKLGIPIVAQENAAKRLSTETKSTSGRVTPALPEVARPTITFKDNKTLTIPGVTAEMTFTPQGHTDGDIFIYLKEANVIVAGDLLHTNEYPYLDEGNGGTLAGNFKAMQAILAKANDDTKIIPGHGLPVSKKEFKAYLDMMYDTSKKVAALIKQGKSEEEVVAMKLLADDTSVPPGGPDNRDKYISVTYKAEAAK